MKILFVCTANICRSVMAEALLRHLLSGNSKSFDVRSAGVHALSNHRPDEFTTQICSDHGLDVGSHRSRQLTEQMLDQSDLVLCLAKNHKQVILSAYPRFKSKVFLLKEFHRQDAVKNPSVDDPIGRPLRRYEQCYKEIEQEVKRIAPMLPEKEKHPRTKP